MYLFSLLVLFLACYSFLGWVWEVGYVFATTQHLENRGFLTGPFLPIYGIGALALLILVAPYVTNPFVVFVACVVVTSVIEFTGHLMLDKIFHISLWDYHDKPFNLQGRICLENSLGFGALGLLLIYVIHPFLRGLLNALPEDAAIAIAWTLLGILLIDTANSVRSLAKIRPVLDEVAGTLTQAHDRIEARAVEMEKERKQRRATAESAHIGTIGRLARVFPRAKSVRSPESTGA
jgi:uncharacterized membrane protein